MQNSYKLISFQRNGDVLSVRLQNPRVDDQHIEGLGTEFTRLIDEEMARKIVVCLGPEEPDCLMSVFLAKLISLQRRLNALGGILALAHVSAHTRGTFRAAGIERLFHFYSDEQSAAKALHAPG